MKLLLNKLCASSWIITKINILRCTVSKMSILELFIDIQNGWTVPRIMRFIEQSRPRRINEALHLDNWVHP